jgi:glycosyltransferase involved in cell wall biosynthesis
MPSITHPRLSVIVTTYNNPRALTLVLAGLERQTVREFELLIADDGSGPETAALVAQHASRGRMPIRHVWHPDEGFRKCMISNKAILAASGEYLVFFDGDCLPPSRCLEAHLRAARPGSYLAGGKIPMSKALGSRLTVEQIERGMLDGVGLWWLGVGKRRRLLLSHLPVLRDIMDRRVPRQPAWRGENSSAFAADLHRIGGFDERFTYGFEDADLGHRLQAAGVQGRSLRYTTPVFHLDHPHPYVKPNEVATNRALYEHNRALRLTRTPYGLPGA